jgi:hypothetical protein
MDGDMPLNTSDNVLHRRVRVYQMDINHMQCTPMFRKENWCVQIETLGNYRSHSLLWSRCTDDPYQRWSDKGEIFGHSAFECVEIAKSQGIINY